MLDDFFFRAIIAGLGIALLCGPMGCYIVWRRLAFFGDTLAHAALLGVALAFLLHINTTLAVFGLAFMLAICLLLLKNRVLIPNDSLLGTLSHAALAFGLVVLSLVGNLQVDLMQFLFGNILSISTEDILQIYLAGAVVLGVLAKIWHPLFAATVSEDLAAAEGLHPKWIEGIFMLLMAIVIALSMKVVGVLLITSMLIIPAASARHFARSPEQMAIYSALFGMVAVVAGLYGSLYFDTPSGPSIVTASAGIFILGLFGRR